jgi:hypothetical protein
MSGTEEDLHFHAMKWLPVVVVALVARLALLIFHTMTSGVPLVEAGHRHDSGWYQRIAETGYPQHPEGLGAKYVQTEWAFFPLYPMLVRGLMTVSGMRAAAAMDVLSWPLMILALTGFAGLARRHLPAGTDIDALMLYACFPFSVFLHVHYSEALFMALLFWSFIAIFDRRPALAALFLSALVLVRPTGLFMLAPAFLYHIERSGFRHSSGAGHLRSVVVIVPAVIAFTLFCAYQHRMTGDPFVFSTAQAGWGRSLTWPWQSFFNSADPATQIESVYTLLLIPLAFLLMKGAPRSFRLLVAINILLPLLSGSVDSMTRFTLVMFPLFLYAAPVVATSKLRRPVLAVMLVLQIFCAWLWSIGHPLMA